MINFCANFPLFDDWREESKQACLDISTCVVNQISSAFMTMLFYIIIDIKEQSKSYGRHQSKRVWMIGPCFEENNR